MVKIIALFNHKGGVSKTTTTFNLGWALAEKGHATLIVDADPQSNLTSLALSIPDEESFERLYNRKDSNDIYSLTNASTSNRMEIEGEDAKIINTQQERLFILPGHLQIEDFSTEITLALEVGRSSAFARMRNVPGFLEHALRRIATINKLDYIVIDMAPSLSGLNEALLMGADYFIAPCSPDFFSEIALKNLAKKIPEWNARIKNHNEITDYPLTNAPQFIGVIQQKYRPRRKNEGDDRNRPATSFQKWIDRVRAATNQNLVPALEKVGLVISREKFAKCISDTEPYDLAYISDFNSLVAASQLLNKPVFTLTEEEINSCSRRFGASLETAVNDVDKFKETFAKLADNVVALTSTPR